MPRKWLGTLYAYGDQIRQKTSTCPEWYQDPIRLRRGVYCHYSYLCNLPCLTAKAVSRSRVRPPHSGVRATLYGTPLRVSLEVTDARPLFGISTPPRSKVAAHHAQVRQCRAIRPFLPEGSALGYSTGHSRPPIHPVVLPCPDTRRMVDAT